VEAKQKERSEIWMFADASHSQRVMIFSIQIFDWELKVKLQIYSFYSDRIEVSNRVFL
jgi:hypothetical protein